MQNVGVDLLKINRLKPLEGKWDDPFFKKAFTEKEIEFCLNHERPLVAFCEGFAAKEAVFKSLGMDGDSVRFDSIEILRNEIGQPTVTLLSPLDEKAKALGINRVALSLSYEEDAVIAFAISE